MHNDGALSALDAEDCHRCDPRRRKTVTGHALFQESSVRVMASGAVGGYSPPQLGTPFPSRARSAPGNQVSAPKHAYGEA